MYWHYLIENIFESIQINNEYDVPSELAPKDDPKLKTPMGNIGVSVSSHLIIYHIPLSLNLYACYQI